MDDGVWDCEDTYAYAYDIHMLACLECAGVVWWVGGLGGQSSAFPEMSDSNEVPGCCKSVFRSANREGLDFGRSVATERAIMVTGRRA